MPFLFTLDEICRATGGEARGVSAEGISSLSIDTRTLEEGALFVAIRGERFDGHDFVPDAIKAGASAALVSADRAAGLEGQPLVVVRDALEGLRDLARAARARATARVVGVTGSVGKTSTKEALRLVLSGFGTTHASIKSYNNHWGVPLMLAGLPPDADFGVFEMGMNHSGEITPLSQMVQPEIAVISAIAPAHIGFLGSMEAIARAKAEIFDGMQPGGLAIINADHEQLDILASAAAGAGLRAVTFGYSDKAEVRITDYAGHETGSEAMIGLERPVKLSIGVAGQHMMSNAVAALLVAEELGLDLDQAIPTLAEYSAGQGRGKAELVGDPAQSVLLMDESYNANPASVKAALDVFATREAPAGKRVLVLGDMRELGEQAEALHLSLSGAIIAARPDLVFLVGPYMKALVSLLESEVTIGGTAETREEIEPLVLNSLAAGDAVMVKASLGTGLGALVSSIRDHFKRDA